MDLLPASDACCGTGRGDVALADQFSILDTDVAALVRSPGSVRARIAGRASPFPPVRRGTIGARRDVGIVYGAVVATRYPLRGIWIPFFYTSQAHWIGERVRAAGAQDLSVHSGRAMCLVPVFHWTRALHPAIFCFAARTSFQKQDSIELNSIGLANLTEALTRNRRRPSSPWKAIRCTATPTVAPIVVSQARSAIFISTSAFLNSDASVTTTTIDAAVAHVKTRRSCSIPAFTALTCSPDGAERNPGACRLSRAPRIPLRSMRATRRKGARRVPHWYQPRSAASTAASLLRQSLRRRSTSRPRAAAARRRPPAG